MKKEISKLTFHITQKKNRRRKTQEEQKKKRGFSWGRERKRAICDLLLQNFTIDSQSILELSVPLNTVLRPVPQRLTTTSCSAETTPDGVVSLEEKRGAQVLVMNWFSFLPIENFHSEIDWFWLKGSVNFFYFLQAVFICEKIVRVRRDGVRARAHTYWYWPNWRTLRASTAMFDGTTY